MCHEPICWWYWYVELDMIFTYDSNMAATAGYIDALYIEQALSIHAITLSMIFPYFPRGNFFWNRGLLHSQQLQFHVRNSENHLSYFGSKASTSVYAWRGTRTESTRAPSWRNILSVHLPISLSVCLRSLVSSVCFSSLPPPAVYHREQVGHLSSCPGTFEQPDRKQTVCQHLRQTCLSSQAAIWDSLCEFVRNRQRERAN